MSLFTQILMSAQPVTSHDGLVIVMGAGMVFFGLICLIAICYLLGAILKLVKKDEKPQASVSTPVASAQTANSAPIENKQELVAVISAVIAEELGTSVSAIRIKSIKRI